MRRILSLALALLTALSLTACGGKADQGYRTEDVQAMADAGAFSEELEEVDTDTAFLLYRLADYGLSREDIKQCAVLRSAGATCEEGAVLVLSSKDKAKSAADALLAYIEAQIEANEDYRPGEIPKLQEACISTKGSTVLMAVASDRDAAIGAVDGEAADT